jgi:hypothetical protein
MPTVHAHVGSDGSTYTGQAPNILYTLKRLKIRPLIKGELVDWSSLPFGHAKQKKPFVTLTFSTA